MGRVVGREAPEKLTLLVNTHDQVRDLILIAAPEYIDVLVGATEDREAVLGSLRRPRPPGSQIDFDAVRHEANGAITRMMRGESKDVG